MWSCIYTSIKLDEKLCQSQQYMHYLTTWLFPRKLTLNSYIFNCRVPKEAGLFLGFAYDSPSLFGNSQSIHLFQPTSVYVGFASNFLSHNKGSNLLLLIFLQFHWKEEKTVCCQKTADSVSCSGRFVRFHLALFRCFINVLNGDRDRLCISLKPTMRCCEQVSFFWLAPQLSDWQL